MEIRNMLIRQTTAGADQPLLLQKGQIYEVAVKEVKGNEAVVHIKGIDVKVRAEGEWPKEGRAAIQIVNEQDGFPIARIVSRPQTEAVEQMTRSAVSEPLSSELKQIELWLQKQGQPLTKETISTLRTFFAESSGTVEQKLDTVRAVINKKLELTSTHLTAVHEALHGPPFGERLAAVAKKLDPTFVQGNEVAQSTENEATPPHSLNMDDHSERMQKPVTDTFSRGADQGNRTADRIRELAAKELPTKSLLPEETVYSRDGGQKTKESLDKDNIWHTSSQAAWAEKPPASERSTRFHQLREQVIREPNVSKAVEYARRQVVEAADVERNVAERLDRVLREVVQLQQQGLKIEALVRLNQALIQMEQEVCASGEGQQPKHQNFYDSRDLARQIRDIRTEAVRTMDLSEVLPRIRSQLVEDGRVPAAVRQKVEAALKETIWLQQINQHRLAKTHLVRQLAQLEQMAAVGHTVHPAVPVSAGQTVNVQETVDGAVGKEAARTSAASPLEPMESVIEHEPPRHAPLANVQETDAAQRTGQIYEAIRQAIKLFQHEPILDKALDVVQGKMREALHSQPHWRQSWNDAFAKAMELKEKGRELAARQTVLKTLNEIEASLPSVPTDRSLDVDSLFDGAWQAALSLESKQFFVQTVTKKMAQAALDFKTVKRDVMRQLETVAQVAENKSPAARLQATSMLEMAIKQLDNAILKSDIMLFTDMVMEKQLMKASSALAEAKKRLRQGDAAGARNIVNEVKNMLANIVFKPSEAKVKHFVRMQGETTADSSKAFLEQVNQVMQPPADGPSARHVFDTIRRLGLMHEYEAAERLVLKGNEEESALPNIKKVLLRLAQSGNESVARQAEQALTNLTGQQLLNKWDGMMGWQSFFFTLPLLWQHEVRNVNVYVNARQDGERIDWENCQLYFLLETKKLGDLGILLQANERNLSITLRNDRDDFAQKAAPFIEMAKKRLEEIGYHVKAINVDKLTNETKREEEEKRAPSIRPYGSFTERGYDFTI
ncbi:hypothetical protein A3Q36_02665 [Geobacillus stearothermophilus]|nr:hypothetical protein A3Q36_02665 [Geobacillus stearothermophilus]